MALTEDYPKSLVNVGFSPKQAEILNGGVDNATNVGFLDSANTWGGVNTFNNDLILENQKALQGKEVGGTPRDLIQRGTLNETLIGDGVNFVSVLSDGSFSVSDGTEETLVVSSNSVTIPNNHAYRSQLASGTAQDVVKIDTSNNTVFSSDQDIGLLPTSGDTSLASAGTYRLTVQGDTLRPVTAKAGAIDLGTTSQNFNNIYGSNYYSSNSKLMRYSDHYSNTVTSISTTGYFTLRTKTETLEVGDAVYFWFCGSFSTSVSAKRIYLRMEVDGTQVPGGSAIWIARMPNSQTNGQEAWGCIGPVEFKATSTSHTFTSVWAIDSGTIAYCRQPYMGLLIIKGGAFV